MSPCFDRPFAPASVGLTTAVTPGSCSTFASAASIAAAFAGSVSAPLRLCSTTCAVAPAWAGNRSFSRSVACWLSVPGIVKLSL